MTVVLAGTGALAEELATFRRSLHTLLSHQGEYVLIVGDKVIGCYRSHDEALGAGYTEAGLNPFLVKKIAAVETAMHLTRDIASPCRTTPSP